MTDLEDMDPIEKSIVDAIQGKVNLEEQKPNEISSVKPVPQTIKKDEITSRILSEDE